MHKKRKMRRLHRHPLVKPVSTYKSSKIEFAEDSPHESQTISRKELAHWLGRNVGFISAMKKAGYRPPEPNWYTLRSARQWLAMHPDFRTHKAYPSKDRKTRQPLPVTCQIF